MNRTFPCGIISCITFVPLLLSLLTPGSSRAQLVISQVYGGGGATSGSPPFKNDYIEIFNRGTFSVDLTGFSLQYAPATGASWSVTSLSGSIGPGQYYLVQEAGGSLGNPLPTADATGTIAMSATNGKVALVSSTTALTGACPTSNAILDLVGYGSANCFEGSGATAPLSNTLAALRQDDGCTDTDNNSSDLPAGTPSPHNTSSPVHPCAPVPIQLNYFSGAANPVTGDVDLRWGTLSETNNYGFELQKRLEPRDMYTTIPNSFVPGHGTTIVPQHYTFSDPAVSAGTWSYRLRQIDLEGTAHHSQSIQIGVLTDLHEEPLRSGYRLEQNHPNPFNPSTTIEFSLANRSAVTLKVYDLIGRHVATLVDQELPPGRYTVEWNAGGVAGGVYLCRLTAGGFAETKKIVVLR